MFAKKATKVCQFLGDFSKLVDLSVVKDCSIKFRSKHSTVLPLCLLRNLMEQTIEAV